MMTVATWADWGVFAATVLGTGLLIRLVFGASAKKVSVREATIQSAIWIGMALAFASYLYFAWTARLGNEPGRALATQFLVAYLVEKSLSVDNLFVFLVVFNHFKIPERLQPRVLLYGVVGAVVMRAVFIGAGTALLHQFHWILYLFGAFLVFQGIKLLFEGDGEDDDPSQGLALRLARRVLRTTDEPAGDAFVVRKPDDRGKLRLHATPLLVVVIVIEITDLVFAVDSVPAVLACSRDLFVVYTSNILAILGLRALYFMLAGAMSAFRYLKHALCVILTFIGLKLLLADLYPIPNVASLLVILAALLIAIAASALIPQRRHPSVTDAD